MSVFALDYIIDKGGEIFKSNGSEITLKVDDLLLEFNVARSPEKVLYLAVEMPYFKDMFL